MHLRGHPYRNAARGRSLKSAPGVGSVTHTAHLACSACPAVGERKLRQVMPPEQIDQKFAQAGWSLDPHICPDCRRKAAEEKNMASHPSPAAVKAIGKVFGLLSAHFDVDAGRYAPDWGDQKIADETGIGLEAVMTLRKDNFGEIKEPVEIGQLRADIGALEQLLIETTKPIKDELIALRSRVGDLSKRWAA